MGKPRKKTTRPGMTTSHPPEVGALKEQLRQLSIDQFVEIVEKFLARLGEKERLEFMNFLPSVHSQDLERQLPYHRDEDFLEVCLHDRVCTLSSYTRLLSQGLDLPAGALPALILSQLSKAVPMSAMHTHESHL
jgi:hypothetical protein